jgi:hypothetical protein
VAYCIGQPYLSTDSTDLPSTHSPASNKGRDMQDAQPFAFISASVAKLLGHASTETYIKCLASILPPRQA